MVNTVVAVLGWLVTVLVAAAAAIAVDVVAVGVLFRYLPGNWDLTGNYFTLTVPVASALVILPVLGAGAFLGLNQFSRLLVFYLVMVATTVTMLANLSNPPWDIARYVLWITWWWAVAFVALRARRQAGRQDTVTD